MTATEHVAGQLDLNGAPVPPAAVAKPNPTTITLNLDVEIDLSADECWPDGEPEHWTVDDLASEIRRQHSSLDSFLREWALLDMGGSVELHDGRGGFTTVNLR